MFGIEKLTLRKKGKTKEREILKNQLIQKAQQYFTNIASIFGSIEIQKIRSSVCIFLRKVSS